MPPKRRSPQRHTVHTRDPRYNMDQYNRGKAYTPIHIAYPPESSPILSQLERMESMTRPGAKLRLKKDYGDVKLYSIDGRDYLIGKDEGKRTLEDNKDYAVKIATILDTLDKGVTNDITYIVINPNHGHSGELSRGMLPPEIYDSMGKRNVHIFLNRNEGDGERPKYGIIFGSEVWDENKNHLPHLVKHEVGHLDYYKRGEAYRDAHTERYQEAAEKFIKTAAAQERGVDVKRGGDGKIFRVDGLGGITFRKDLWESIAAPSIYSMKSPSEYHAELYANGLV